METLQLNVPTMTCMGCVNAITNGLKTLGNIDVNADINARKVTVSYDSSKVGSQEILDKLKALGYLAEIAS